MSVLICKNCSFRYPTQSSWLIENFNAQFLPGTCTIIHGKNGTGKSTLLYLLCNVIPTIIPGETSGSILLNNRNISEYSLPEIAPYMSLLLQEPDLQLFFPTVIQELAFGPENCQVSPKEIQRRIHVVSTALGITTLLQQPSRHLSYGQKKLVAFGALLTLNPDIFLLDEPFAGLSGESCRFVSKIIDEKSQKGTTFIIAEHKKDWDTKAHNIITLHHKSYE